MLTETDEIAVALRAAADRWPDDRDRPTRLLLGLVREGHRAISEAASADVERRLAAIEATAGIFTGLYIPGYLDELRAEWPD